MHILSVINCMQSPQYQTPQPKLQNVVATFNLDRKLDLLKVAMVCGFVHYVPTKFAAAVIKLDTPRTTCLIFASGKAVCTGAKNEQKASVACMKFVMLLQNSGIQNIRFMNFKVQNMVSAVHCPFKLDLCRLSDSVSGFCSYEPNLFPGLVFRAQIGEGTPEEGTQREGTSKAGSISNLKGRHKQMKRKKMKSNEIVFICFASGRCVITGGKNRAQILIGWNKFFSGTLLMYRALVNYGSSGNFKHSEEEQKRFNLDCAFFDERRAILMSIGAIAPRIRHKLFLEDGQYVDLDESTRAERTRDQSTLCDVRQLQGCTDTKMYDTSMVDIVRQADSMRLTDIMTFEVKKTLKLYQRIFPDSQTLAR